MIKEFHNFAINEEAAIRFPNDLEYWKKKGKKGKEVIIFTHDDMDGIFSAVAMKEYLLSHGFTIAGYGVVNYTDGWKVFSIDKEYINVCIDYAEDNADLDLYIDHHMEEGDLYKKSEYSIKMKSDSCYGLITRVLGMPTDKWIISVISMIDAAKYNEYEVDIKTILNFNLRDIMKEKNPRLVFAGAFNQLIKRSDYKTIIEVIANSNLSIYKIFKCFKIFYPLNNLSVKRGSDKEEIRRRILMGEPLEDDEQLKAIPEFVPDSTERMGKMMAKTTGEMHDKPTIYTVEDFDDFYWKQELNKYKFDGFVVIKNLVYVPVGTWANALRVRALIEKTLGRAANKIQFILLDYGASLQIAAYKNIETMDKLPILRGGEVLNDLDKYTRFLLQFVLPRIFGFKYAGAKSGGHPGIGNLSNILGKSDKEPFQNIKFMDLMKNWIIHDITGIKWKINMVWNENPQEKQVPKEKEINKKVMMMNQIRKVNI
jgi:hypothetical protein